MPEDAAPAVRALSNRDIPAALDLIYAEWAKIPRACQEQMIRRDPWRHRQRSFGAFVGGRLVAHARFHYRPVRINRAILRMVGVCEVVTHPDYRRRGLGHRVLKAALQWMHSSGVHFTMLYTGVHPFYAALGWGTLAQDICYVPAGSIPQLGEAGYRIAHLPIEQTPPTFATIYQQSCGQHPISLLRTPAYWRNWPRWAKGNLWFGLLDDLWTVASKDDTVVAYGGIQRSILKDGSVGIVEACALPGHQAALFDIHDDLIARCRQAGGDLVELNLPPDHPFVSRLAPIGRHTINNNAMVRVVDLPGLLDVLLPELNDRSSTLRAPARVRLESDLGSAALAAGAGSVTLDDSTQASRASLTPAGLGSLLLGFRAAPELAAQGEIEAKPAVIELLDLLFPCQRSHYWQIDHF